jgi:predicted metal-binding membrane protein
MALQIQNKNSGSAGVNRLPAEFIVVCVVAFIGGISATVYFTGSMASEMAMPGGWTMSMMWMRMPGQTWFLSALSFLLMWLAMMLAMMIPSAMPAFLKTRRRWRSLCYMAAGYFSIWLMAGVGIYILGIRFNSATMHSAFLSRAVPLLSGAVLIAAGIVQFTRWKLMHLLRCRSPFGCATSCPPGEASFRLGCKQGLDCCACCSALMATQLILGIMNPFVMVVIAIAITGEKLLPRPELVARLTGIATVVTGIVLTIHWAIYSYA